MEVFEIALRNAGPAIEVKPKRVGGATYQGGRVCVVGVPKHTVYYE